MHQRRVWSYLVCAIAIGIGRGEVRAEPSAAEQEIHKASASYAEAVNAGNVEGVLALWTEDADYVDELGNEFKGKAAIAKMVKENIENPKRGKLTIEVATVRFPAETVAIEDGVLHLSLPTGVKESTKYTAVWVKKEGKWLLSSVRDLSGAAPADSPASNLVPLQWLVGTWASEETSAPVEIHCQWALAEKFLRITFHVSPPEGGKVEVEQLVGWDPASNQVRSWVFDSHGGYGQGAWDRDGNTWAVTAVGVLPNGQQGIATNLITFVDESHFVWESTNRQIEGIPVPDSKVKFTRKEK